MIRFPDVSFYQGVIDWEYMRVTSDISRVIIRAGQGGWSDPKFEFNYSEAKRVGLQRGVYWFYDDRYSPRHQRELLVSMLGRDLPELPIFCDWERTYFGRYSGLGNVVAFMQDVERALPECKVGMYTGYYWFLSHSNAIRNYFHLKYLKTKPLWLAWYVSDFQRVKVPRPWTEINYWQYGTPQLTLGQSSKEIDMNLEIKEIL